MTLRFHIFRFRSWPVLVWMLLAGIPAASEPTDPEVGTVTISAIENEGTHELIKPVVRTAYRRIGHGVRFEPLPARRALEWANDGITDGDLARIEGTERKYPNLIRISVPVFHFQGVVFSRTVDRSIEDWSDLQGLLVGVIRGIRYSEIGTAGMDRILAKDMTHLFTLLSIGHIEAAVAVRDAGRIEIHRNFRGKGIRVVGEPLYTGPLFHFIHSRNGHLVVKLEAVLREMAASGEIEAMRLEGVKEKLGR